VLIEILFPEFAGIVFGGESGYSHLGATPNARMPVVVDLKENFLAYMTPHESNLCRVLDYDSFLVVGICW